MAAGSVVTAVVPGNNVHDETTAAAAAAVREVFDLKFTSIIRSTKYEGQVLPRTNFVPGTPGSSRFLRLSTFIFPLLVYCYVYSGVLLYLFVLLLFILIFQLTAKSATSSPCPWWQNQAHNYVKCFSILYRAQREK